MSLRDSDQAWTGNILLHPGSDDIECRVPFETPNADRVMENAFVIRCHQSLTDTQLEYMIRSFRELFETHS